MNPSRKVSYRNLVLALSLIATSFVSHKAFAGEPRILMMGVWPDRIRIFDEKTDEFVSEFRLRNGAVTWSSGGSWLEAHTPDYRRFYLITRGLETVEVVDITRQTVIDEIKISTADRRVRVHGVAPDAAGKLLYLLVRPVTVEPDRFVTEDMEVIVYDSETRQIKKTFPVPDEIKFWWPPMMRLSPDGKSLFLFGEDIYEVSTATHEIVDRIALSKSVRAGYGPVFLGEDPALLETEPYIFHGVYSTADPFMEKPMTGVVRLDLLGKEMETFEIGPAYSVSTFALSSDGKRGYAGLIDLLAIDMEAQRVVKRIEGFEQGRPNNSLIASGDGKKLYISGVGDQIHVHDAETLERRKSIFAGGDFISPPFALPRDVLGGETDH